MLPPHVAVGAACAMEVPPSVVLLVLAFVATCCAVDITTRRIPNFLSVPVILGGVLLNAMRFGAPGFVSSLLGVLLVVAFLIAPFSFGGIGGGDVKMMAGVGALVGPYLALASLGMGMAIGGVMMVVHLARLGRLRDKLDATARMIWTALTTLSFAPLRVPAADTSAAVTLPYSVPLGLGTMTILGLALRG